MRVIARTLIVAGLILAGLVLAAFALSPGETAPILGEDGQELAGSVAEARMVVLGGREQFVLIRGRDVANPILLILHGGPGDAEGSSFRYFNAALEDHFVVVHWDQRGAGRSFSQEIPPESMTTEQLVADSLELVGLLERRFRPSGIVVAGHSWGSYLGLRLVHEHPDAFAAFVGMGQVSDQAESERRGFDWALREARRRGDEIAVRELEELGPPVRGRYRGGLTGLGQQRKWVREFGGAAHGRDNFGALWMFAWPTLVFPEYRLVDKLRYLEAEAFSMAHLEEPMLDDPPAARMLEFAVPVFVLQGRHDRQTDFELAKAYVDALRAPHKEFVTFEDSAHLVPFEQPGEFLDVMVQRVRPWAL